MTPADWIAADWGTTNLRVWGMGQDGSVMEARQSDRGMGQLRPGEFEGALLDLAGDLLGPKTCQVVVCGMAGARQGWKEAPYEHLPWRPEHRRTMRVPTRDPRLSVSILHGLAQSAPADVMRGEETQIAGFLAGKPGFDGVICLPGTHSKWVRCAEGMVEQFRTVLTGELFELLSERSILRHSVGPGWDDDAFLAGVDRGLRWPDQLGGDLFGLRAEGLLDDLPPDAARARLSGLLIGSELAGQETYCDAAQIVLIGASGLCDRYEAALRWCGRTPVRADATAMTLNGLTAVYRQQTGGTP